MIGVVDLNPSGNRPNHIDQTIRIGCGDEKGSPWAQERSHSIEKRAWRAEVLDHLTGDHHIRWFNAKGRHSGWIGDIHDIGLKPRSASRIHTLLIRIESDDLSGSVGEMAMQPPASTCLFLKEPCVSETNMDHTVAAASLDKPVDPLNNRCRRQRMHHFVLTGLGGGRVHGASGSNTVASAATLLATSANGRSAPATSAPTFDRIPDRPHQRSRLPRAPTSGTTQRSSSGSKS